MKFRKGDLVRWRNDEMIGIVLGEGSYPNSTKVTWITGEHSDGVAYEPVTRMLVLHVAIQP